ncbi:insulin-like growth factor 1 receptor isoform X2 [Stylophora pistillata]|uniref:insulin-like growth factor 1 receptor isoform X2 n=1 Tax=Stylophora pistillata TaxID=50429 RepID=UPI000C0401F0|nr:insulin-like growth factor 1 receptor isoform X2 [Stylophora pistillata]
MAQVRAMVVLTVLNSLVAHSGSSGAKIFRAYHQKMNYTEADKACRIKNYGDYLAKIKTTNDLQLARNISNTTNGMKYWMGLNLRNGDWEWSDKKMAGIKLVDIVKNLNRTEALSKEPRKFCCLVTHDALLECTNCSEKHAFICEDFQELPPPPKRFTVENVQTRYLILTWDEPENASFQQILSYTVEQRTSISDNFTVLKTIPYPETKMIMENLEPSTEYTIRLSSNNMHGRSEGVLVTQRTLPNNFFMKLMLKIVLPLSLASLLVVVVCVKYGPIRNSKRGTGYTEPQTPLNPLCNWVEIPRTDVTLKEKLGEGAFGQVYKGLVRMGGQVRACAVKSIKEDAREKDAEDLFNELQILLTVGSILMIVRLAPNGCLLNQLRNRENPLEDDVERQVGFTRVDKVRIARDVANGMSHLASKKCVHRDLAARNVLLGERNIAMISDFGLSRDVYESGEYETLRGELLPVRWMALESMEDLVFNTKTDVWSFGILLWEMESRGKRPYIGLTSGGIMSFLWKGKRLPKPEECPSEIYDLMKSCWNLHPEKRPSFADLLAFLENELTENKEDFQGDKNRLGTEPKGITNIHSMKTHLYENGTGLMTETLHMDSGVFVGVQIPIG